MSPPGCLGLAALFPPIGFTCAGAYMQGTMGKALGNYEH